MPTNTWTPLATLTLTGTDSEIVFASIPATYRDLILVANFAHTSSAEEVIYLRFNADSSNGTMVGMRGNGSGAASYTTSSMFFSYAGGVSTTRGNGIVQIMDYSATDKHKTSLVRCDIEALKTEAIANRWASTAAVTSVSLVCQSTPFAIGSTFSLYGVIA
jgi:hypothetical protein